MTTIWTYYVAADMTGHRLCETKHRGPNCPMQHGVPVSAFWSGPVPKDERGDFFIDLKLARREFRNALARWQRRLNRLNRQPCAPPFKGFLQDNIKEHVAVKPVFSFRGKPRWSSLKSSV